MRMASQLSKAVFIRFSPLNDLSAEHVVRGKILIMALMLGHIEVMDLFHAEPCREYLASCFTHAVVVAVSISFASNAAHCGCNLLVKDLV